MAGRKGVSADYLERAALHYLGRYSSSISNLKVVLKRKVLRRLEEGSSFNDEHRQWIDDVVDKCERFGYVDDAVYAKQRAESMLRSGKPLRRISGDLMHKGVDANLIEDVLAALVEEVGEKPDVDAIITYARKRRFGPYRRHEADDKRHQRELSAMIRAGFSYDLAQKIVNLEDEAEIEAWRVSIY